MKTILFPLDTRAPMPAFERKNRNGVLVWVKAWERTPDGYLVKDGDVSDWEAWVWATMLNIVAEEAEDE